MDRFRNQLTFNRLGGPLPVWGQNFEVSPEPQNAKLPLLHISFVKPEPGGNSWVPSTVIQKPEVFHVLRQFCLKSI